MITSYCKWKKREQLTSLSRQNDVQLVRLSYRGKATVFHVHSLKISSSTLALDDYRPGERIEDAVIFVFLLHQTVKTRRPSLIDALEFRLKSPQYNNKLLIMLCHIGVLDHSARSETSPQTNFLLQKVFANYAR